MKHFTKAYLPLLLAVITLLSICVFPVVSYAVPEGYPNTHSNTGNQRNDVCAIAKTQVGYKEDSSGSKYGAWYKSYTGSSYNYTQAPWCAMFVLWCENQAGVTAAVKGMTASSTAMLTNYKNGKNGSSAYAFGSYVPRAGDIIFVGSQSGTSVNHVGLVVAVDSDTIYTIEGNSSNSVREVKYSRSTGKRSWSSRYIKYYGVPAYSGSDSGTKLTPVTDPSGAYTVSYSTKTTSDVNIRAAVDPKAAINGTLKSGTTVKIIKEAKGSDGNLWGKLNDGTGWICLAYTTNGNTSHKTEDKTGSDDKGTDTKTEDTTKFPVSGTVTASSLNVRKSASSSAAVTKVLKRGTVVSITEYKTVSGTKWGKLKEGGWVVMSYIATASSGSGTTAQETTPAQPSTESMDMGNKNTKYGIQCKITSETLNSRTKPSNGSIIKVYNKGETVTVYETRKSGSNLWGRTKEGWIHLKYVEFSKYKVTSSELNVRKSASTSAKIVKTLKRGAEIKIDDIDSSGSTVFAHIPDVGWVAVAYISPVSGSSDQSSSGSGSGSSSGSDSGSSKTEQPAKVETANDGDVIIIGKVKSSTLYVRTKAGNGDKVKTLKKGATVECTKVTMSGKELWGKTADGWVCLDYVEISKRRVVVNTSSMNIRKSASGSASVVGTCSKGDKFWITDMKSSGGNTWGYIQNTGWICLDYTYYG